jgi:hypothetical protein
MAEWVKVAQVGELAPGQKKQIDLDGVAVALFNADSIMLSRMCVRMTGLPWHMAGLMGTTSSAHATARVLMSAPARH